MGNQQMTYSSNQRDGSYADNRTMYETDNFGGSRRSDDAHLIVRNIVDEIIDSACERSDSITDVTKLAPDGDQASFNLRLSSDQNDQVENTRGNPKSVNYLESEESESINIQNILGNSKYEPFKCSSEDVFVDSLEGQFNPHNLFKTECSNINSEDNSSKGDDLAIEPIDLHNFDYLDSKYFKDNLAFSNENSKNLDQFKEMSEETAPELETSDVDVSGGFTDDSKYVNTENNSIINDKFTNPNLSKEIGDSSLESSGVSCGNFARKELYFSTDLNSNIEPVVKRSSDTEKNKEVQSGIVNVNEKVVSSINERSFELVHPSNKELTLDMPEISEGKQMYQQNFEQNLDLSFPKKELSSPVEEFANIVKEICSTIEENNSKSAEICRDIGQNYVEENLSKIEKSSLGKPHKSEESSVSLKKLGEVTETSFNSKEDGCTIEQIKSILQEICSSVEEKTTTEEIACVNESSSLKENSTSNLQETPSSEPPIFTEICSVIEEVSSTLKEKSPYIEPTENNAVEENVTTESKQCDVTESQSLSTEKSGCGETESSPEEIKMEQASEKVGRVSSEICAADTSSLSDDRLQKYGNLFTENCAMETFSTDETSLPCPNNDNSIMNEINTGQNDAKTFSECTKTRQQSNTVEEMLSLFKEICSSAENRASLEDKQSKEPFRRHSQDCNKNRDISMTKESHHLGNVPKSPILDHTKSKPDFEETKPSLSSSVPEEIEFSCVSESEKLKPKLNISAFEETKSMPSEEIKFIPNSTSTEIISKSSSLVTEEEKSTSDYPSVFEENSSPYILEDDSSTADEVFFQLAPESPVEEAPKTIDDNKLKENIFKNESNSEDFHKKSAVEERMENVPYNSKNAKEQRLCLEELSSSIDGTKDKNLYKGDHICDLDEVISQFRQKHSTDIRSPNTQITRSTKIQESSSVKNKTRLNNNKKIQSLGSSPSKEYSNAPLVWSKESTTTKNAGGEIRSENRKVMDSKPTENADNPRVAKENNPEKEEIKACEVKECEKGEKILNTKQTSTPKLQENKVCDAPRELSKERNELTFQIKNLNKTQKITRFIVKELIGLISLWMEDSRKENMELKECKQKLIFERDQAMEDLRSVENAFSDLHRRYEKSKTFVEEFKENEDRLKQQIAEATQKFEQQKEMYKLLKKRSEERIEEANSEIVNVEKSKETEIAVLKAQLRKAEMKANGLEKSLEQKMRENTELSSICEDLIAKVGKK